MRKHYQLATILALPAIAHDHLEVGSPEWLDHRRRHRNASDAPAIMGADENRSRNDVLLANHRGFQPEVDSFKQGILDSGHSIEALMRPLAEALVGEELYARVYTRGIVGASLDGGSFAGDTVWENKRLNDALRAALPHIGPNCADLNDARDLPLKHQIQMEQQLLVRGAQRALFSAGHEEGGKVVDARYCWYTSNPELRQRILTEWNQFEEDEETYTPPEVVEVTPIVVKRPDQLPALRTEVKGALLLESNLKEWEEAALAFIKDVRSHELKTDEDFDNADAAVKWCLTSKETLVGVRAHLLSATGDVNVAIGTLDRIMGELDGTRLGFTNAIRTRKETRKTEMADEAKGKLSQYLAGLNERLAKLMPTVRGHLMPEMTHPKIAANFGKCFLNKRSFKNMQDALDQELARAKIAAGEIADLFEANVDVLNEEGKGYGTLFADWRDLLWKPTEDLRAVVRQRVADHQAEEKRRAEAAAEAERQRLERERLAEEERQRRRDEENAAASNAMQAISEARRTESMPPEVLGDLEQAATGLITDMAITRAAGGPRLRSVGDVVDAEVKPQPQSTLIPLKDCNAGPADGARQVTPVRAVPNTPPTLKVGDINSRLGFIVTSALIIKLGFQPSVQEGTKILWHTQEFPFICDALIRHIASVRNSTPAAEEAA